MAAFFPFPDAPRPEQYEPCIKCGLCLDSCPTFQETGEELESPRGRVQLLAAVARGTVPLDAPKLAHTLFSCLDCRACEVACPSGVPIGSLIERGRAQVVLKEAETPPRDRPASVDTATRLALRHLIGHPRRLKWVGKITAFAQRRGLFRGRLAQRLPLGMRRLAQSLPPIDARAPDLRGRLRAQEGRPVALFLGCVMDVVFHGANEATVRVLERNGYAVRVPAGQRCCGALATHAGDRESAKRLARANIDAFLADPADYVVTNAGGCGAALTEYPEWLEDDPAYAERARAFAAKVRDLSQALVEGGFRPPTGGIAATVTYQASCHLHNVQKATREPMTILSSIPGITVRPMADPARCCGSAGIYNLTHPEMAERLLARKMADVPEDVDTVITGNPGCWMQLLHGKDAFRPTVKVRHLAELLDEAYGSPAIEPGSGPVARG